MAQDKSAGEAPYGWSVIGEDGRRIDRWLSITAAQELVARIAANSDEQVTLEPSEPNAVSTAGGAAASAGVGGDVAAQVGTQTVADLKKQIADADAPTLDALEAAENESETPRSTLFDAIDKRRAELDAQ